MKSSTLQSIVLRIAAVAMAVGGAIVNFTTWAEVFAPLGIGGILMAAGGATLGIYTRQPKHAEDHTHRPLDRPRP